MQAKTRLTLLASMAFSLSIFGQGTVPADKAQRKQLNPDELKAYEEGSIKIDDLETRDGVYLSARYWPAKRPGKDVPAVILVHGKNGTQREWYALAHKLSGRAKDEANPEAVSKYNMAVIAFDFRGHGDSLDVNPEVYKTPKEAAKAKSVKKTAANRIVPQGTREKQKEKTGEKAKRKPSDIKIDLKTDFRNATELGKFLVYDLEAVKKFLVIQHNEGALNIRQTGIIASDMGVQMALKWLTEYEYPSSGTRVGFTQQGGDVVSLVMISPSWSYEGLAVPGNVTKLKDMTMLLVAGNEKTQMTEAEKLAKHLNLKSLSDKTSRKNDRENSGWLTLKSGLAGSALLSPPVEIAPGNMLDGSLCEYMKNRLVPTKGNSWVRREEDEDLGGFGTGR